VGASGEATPYPERLVALVIGRVQGVGFRYFVQDEARRLNLVGFTRNLAEGRTVEVVAEGGRGALEQFLRVLRQGPPGSYVEHVGMSWEPATGEFGGFGIRR
jgi:acylphosphatase